jgi:hypothetical protein
VSRPKLIEKAGEIFVESKKLTYSFDYSPSAPNAKLSCRGVNADNLCMVNIYIKADTSESHSVTPGLLRRFVYARHGRELMG